MRLETSDVVCRLESSCNLWGTGEKMGPALKGMRTHFLFPKASEGDCFKNRMAEDCLLVHSIFVTVPFSGAHRETKQDFSPIKACPAASIIPKADSSHSYPEAAPGLCITYFPLLSHNTRPKQLEEGSICFGSDFKSEPITTRKVWHRSLQWLAALHPKAKSRGRWGYEPWDRTAHCEGAF